MEARKQLWKEVQDYVHVTGVVAKKLGVHMLKANHKWQDDNVQPSHATLDACKAWRRDNMNAAILDVLQGFTGTEELKKYISECLQGQAWSKSPNIFLFFTAKPTNHTKRPVEEAGISVTGTFTPRRVTKDANTNNISITEYSSNSVHFGSHTAELELVVAKPGVGFGKSLILWALGDLLAKRSGTGGKYTKIVSLTTTKRIRDILRTLRFRFTACDVRSYGDGQQDTTEHMTRGSNEQLYVLDCTEANIIHIRSAMTFERQGLHRVCPPGGPAHGGIKAWQLCR